MSTTAAQLPLYRKEAKYEFLRLLRARSFSLATIGFPLMFYLLFGVALAHADSGPFPMAKYLLATYSIFGLVGSSLFGISVTLASERTLGWLEVKQASPMPPAAYLIAKLLTALGFGLIIFGLLLTLATTLGHVHITPQEIIKLALMVILGVFPFASLGLFLALVVPPQAATGIINLIYLPMSFCSGLWLPLKILPDFLQKIAPIWPTYHLSQIAMRIITGANGQHFPSDGSITGHVLYLACFTVVMLAAATVQFRRNASRG